MWSGHSCPLPLLLVLFLAGVVPKRLIGKLTKQHVARAPPPANGPRRVLGKSQRTEVSAPTPARKAGAGGRGCLPRPPARQGTGKPLVVVVFVPVAVGAPAPLVLIPPAMLLVPATLPRCMQFAALVTCLVAVASMFLNSLMEFMFRMRDPPLTAVDVLGMNSGRCTEEKDCGQDRAVKKRRNCACKLLSTNHKLSLTGHMRMSGLRPCSPSLQSSHSHITVFIPPGAVQNCSDPGSTDMWSGHSCPLPLSLVLFFVLIAQSHPNHGCPSFRDFRKLGTTDLDATGSFPIPISELLPPNRNYFPPNPTLPLVN
jgi:hypothetical protein